MSREPTSADARSAQRRDPAAGRDRLLRHDRHALGPEPRSRRHRRVRLPAAGLRHPRLRVGVSGLGRHAPASEPIHDALRPAGRLADMSGEPRCSHSDDAVAAPVLSLENIRKEFGGVVALESVSLDVNAGEVVALVGDNGAGKSTLVKIICGVHPPTAGRILIERRGGALRQSEPGAAARHPGRLPGPGARRAAAGLHEPLPRPRAGDRRRCAASTASRMIRETRELVQAMDVRIPSATAAIRDLSGGQRQGVAIARATHWASQAGADGRADRRARRRRDRQGGRASSAG